MLKYDQVLVLVCNGTSAKLIQLDRHKKSIQGDVIFARENQDSHKKIVDLIANDHHGSVKHGPEKVNTQGSLPSHNEEKKRQISDFVHDALIHTLDHYHQLNDETTLVICAPVNHVHTIQTVLAEHHEDQSTPVLGKDLVKLSINALDAMLVRHHILPDRKGKAA